MKGKQALELGRAIASDFLSFNKSAYSPFIAVSQVEQKLQNEGFKKLDEQRPFHLAKGDRYYIKRGFGSSIIAFDVPQTINMQNENDKPPTAMKLIATHVDSPCLKVAPVSRKKFLDLEQVCVETYGGGLWHTWFDRDLSLGGKVMVQKKDQNFEERMFISDKPVAKIPNLAIHLDPQHGKVFSPNKETELRPIIAQNLEDALNSQNQDANCSTRTDLSKSEKHCPALLQMIASQLNCETSEIIDFDLCFADANPGSFFGMQEEFLSSARIDNLFSAFCSLRGYLENLNDESSNTQNDINILWMFDHEEVGSVSYLGADSSYVRSLLERIIYSLAEEFDPTLLSQILARSLIVSADMAHGVHPNYPSRHQCNHQVNLNQGLVLKYNANMRYITDAASASLIRVLASKHSLNVQDFIVPQDSPCGSTVGPALAAQLGSLGVDVGVPQLSMHSIRESAGVLDAYYYKEFFRSLCSTSLASLQSFS